MTVKHKSLVVVAKAGTNAREKKIKKNLCLVSFFMEKQQNMESLQADF